MRPVRASSGSAGDALAVTPLRAWLERERASRYRWTRFVILRLLGVVYLMGFWVLVNQAVPLLGHDGLLPADSFLHAVLRRYGSTGAAFWQLPSLFWLVLSDTAMTALAWVGTGLSLLLVLGYANAISLALLWALYMSFVHVGQLWYGYGWEIQLLETGFLAIFLADPIDPRPFPRRDAPQPVVWLLRWLAFRVMFGAGLIKIRGDSCWRDLSCLDFHYETQPVPGPLSPFFHFLPHWVNHAGVLYNHLAELVLPFLLFAPRRARHVAGAGMVVFQAVLILSGNLSFLNWLTLVPILAAFDDELIERLVPARARAWVRQRAHDPPTKVRRGVVWALVALIAGLSLGPVTNMLSSEQVMNTSYNAFDLVNTYGAFGSVGRERNEIVFLGTTDPVLGPRTAWKAYEFKCKPGDPDRRPCLMSPYHYRIDWQIWFAAMGMPDEAPWTLHFVWKLLHADRGTLSLILPDPFGGAPPTYVRASLYRYRFAPLGEHGFWRRELVGEWLPALSVDDPRLEAFVESYGWNLPREPR